MSTINQEAINEAFERAKLAAEAAQLLASTQQSMAQLEAAARAAFELVWNRGEAVDIQRFLDQFSPAQQQTLFSAHAATMQLLATYYPDFRPQVPPFAFEWGSNGIVIGDRL
jgi:hypothetical protein